MAAIPPESNKMKKMVLKFAIEDEKSKRRVFKVVAGVDGVDSVSVDMKEKKITVIGNADPVSLTAKLRKLGSTELLSVGPAKEEKKDEKKEEKKDEKKAETDEKNEKKTKTDEKKGKKDEVPPVVYVPSSYNYNYRPYENYNYSYRPHDYRVISGENPNACTIS